MTAVPRKNWKACLKTTRSFGSTTTKSKRTRLQCPKKSPTVWISTAVSCGIWCSISKQFWTQSMPVKKVSQGRSIVVSTWHFRYRCSRTCLCREVYSALDWFGGSVDDSSICPCSCRSKSGRDSLDTQSALLEWDGNSVFQTCPVVDLLCKIRSWQLFGICIEHFWCRQPMSHINYFLLPDFPTSSWSRQPDAGLCVSALPWKSEGIFSVERGQHWQSNVLEQGTEEVEVTDC